MEIKCWGVYGDFTKNIKTNVYDSTTYYQLSLQIVHQKNLRKVKLNLA